MVKEREEKRTGEKERARTRIIAEEMTIVRGVCRWVGEVGWGGEGRRAGRDGHSYSSIETSEAMCASGICIGGWMGFYVSVGGLSLFVTF